MENVVYAPTGFFLSYQAWRSNVSGIVKGPLPFVLGRDEGADGRYGNRSAGARRPAGADRLHAGPDMFAYVVRRVLATIPVMAVVALFVFSLLYIAPGDPAAVIAGDQATPEDVERIRAASASTGPSWCASATGLWQHPARRSRARRSSPTCRSPR